MMHGPIESIRRERVVSRADERLATAWIGRSSTNPDAGPEGTWLLRGVAAAQVSADVPALVMLGHESDGAQALLMAYAKAGARVYTLVGQDWGAQKDEFEIRQAARVFVRRVAEVPASAVCIGTDAWIWIGGGHVLRLSGLQAEALRHTFLRLFWHEATGEAWSGGRAFAWRPARERPFDVPEVAPSATVRLEAADARLSGSTPRSLVHWSDGTPPDCSARRLWFPAGPDHHEQLDRLLQSGVEVVWSELGLPDIEVSADGGIILLPGRQGRLQIRLTAAQSAEVASLLEVPPSWRFRRDVRLGESEHADAEFWLAGAKSPRRLEPEQTIELSPEQAETIRSLDATEPTTFAPARPLALSVRYQWTVAPPRVPKGAAEDSLVGRWQKIDAEWMERLGRARKALDAAENDRGRIGSMFSKLAGAMLGFKRSSAASLTEIDALEELRPSAAGPTGAHELFGRLADIEDTTGKLRADLQEAERKAQEEADREKQRAEWQERIDNAKRALPGKRDSLEKVEEDKRSIAAQLEAVAEIPADADKKTRKDLAARRHKLSDELKNKSAAISRIQSEIGALERTVEETFEYRPRTTSLPRTTSHDKGFIPSATAARNIPKLPDQALPEVGVLRNHRSVRYVVIEAWEQLDAGEAAAQRLAAKLVATEEA